MERHIDDLHTLLTAQQIDKGKEILALLIEGIILHPAASGPEVELRGNLQGLLLQGVLKIQPPNGSRAECKSGGSGGRI